MAKAGRPPSPASLAARAVFNEPMSERSRTNRKYLALAFGALATGKGADLSRRYPWLVWPDGRMRSVILYRLGRHAELLGKREVRRLARRINDKRMRTVDAVDMIETAAACKIVEDMED